MHPHAMSVLSWCCAPESERTAGLPVTGRRSRESLSAARRGESDMASVQKIVLSRSCDIPFNKLVLRQSNVRRVKAGVSIEQLAESIAQRTLLQSLSVRAVVDADGQETGIFEVPAGGRRYRALELLVNPAMQLDKRILLTLKYSFFDVCESTPSALERFSRVSHQHEASLSSVVIRFAISVRTIAG